MYTINKKENRKNKLATIDEIVINLGLYFKDDFKKNRPIVINRQSERIKIANSKKIKRYKKIERKINRIYARLSDILVKLISMTNFSFFVKTRFGLSFEVLVKI